jgi:hypothetical protein
MTEDAQIFGLLFYTVKVMHWFWQKNGLGYTLGDFFHKRIWSPWMAVTGPAFRKLTFVDVYPGELFNLASGYIHRQESNFKTSVVTFHRHESNFKLSMVTYISFEASSSRCHSTSIYQPEPKQWKPFLGIVVGDLYKLFMFLSNFEFSLNFSDFSSLKILTALA